MKMEDIDEVEMYEKEMLKRYKEEMTREHVQEGLLYKDLDKALNDIITGYEMHGVFEDHNESVARVLRMLLEKV